jgi:hypothetical protein
VINVSEISYRVGKAPTKADRKRQKHHRGVGFWIDFTLSGIQEIVWTAAFMLLILTPLLTGRR